MMPDLSVGTLGQGAARRLGRLIRGEDGARHALTLPSRVPHADDPSPSRDAAAIGVWQWLALGLLAATVLFNPALAVVNANVAGLSGGIVAAIQAGLVATAFAVGLANAERAPVRWLILAAALVASNIALGLARDAFNPKYLGDVLTIPAFLCLGARLRRQELVRLLVGLQVLIAVVGVWELLAPEAYAFVLDPRSYYINTRGFADENFWAGGSLFVSAVRGEGRFLLPWTGFHRGSSIFLEPVSLGNWTTMATVLLAAFWRDMRPVSRLVLIVCNLISLCVCDGRLALVTNLILIAALPLLRLAPSRLAALAPVAFGLSVLMLAQFGFLDSGSDDFAGRLRYSLGVLQQTTLAGVLGLEPVEWVDAGYSYLIQTQSALVALGLWLVLMLSDFGEDAAGRRLKFGAAIAITLCLSVSFSIFSVKVSGLLWAAFGCLWSRSGALGDLQLVLRPQQATSPARAPAPLAGAGRLVAPVRRLGDGGAS
ncbi:hypothetical protein LJR219_002684 [Phenylobacterium sp. LjRoot219]|uniref:hypothetical protein n=1 Tax=Phenylobacterium sp. LjRoot219 TaxID=3342283 RepID=UPI003ECE4669